MLQYIIFWLIKIAGKFVWKGLRVAQKVVLRGMIEILLREGLYYWGETEQKGTISFGTIW